MTFQYNDPKFKPRRRELRQNQTDAEKRLWRRLRDRRINNLKFCRQYSVGPYILDFFCSELRLAIELDGSQHLEPDNKVYDKERSAYLESNGIRVLRFWNNDVLTNLEGVLEKILSGV